MGLGNMWGRQTATRMLKEAGFSAVDITPAKDGFNELYVCSKGGAAKM